MRSGTIPPRRPLALLALLALVSAIACEDYPEDPENTLDRARGGTLRVGVSEAEPWITVGEGEPGGLEAELVRGFAESIDAEVEWITGSQEEHLEALAKFELDLVAAGLTAGSPWKTHVGLTMPHVEERWVVGVPPGVPPPEDLEGLEIAVRDAGPAAAWVSAKDARPLRMDDLTRASGPVAAPEWKLRELGYTPTRHDLHTARRVLATPPGENGLLVRLEEHIHRAKRRGRPSGGSR